MNDATRIPLLHRTYLDLFRLYKTAQTALHDLTYLFWECTLRCNLSCLHCGSDCLASSDINDMPRGDFLRVLDEIAQRYEPKKITIAVTGGEDYKGGLQLELVDESRLEQQFP